MREAKARTLAARFSERTGEPRHVVQFGVSPLRFSVLSTRGCRASKGYHYVATFERGKEAP